MTEGRAGAKQRRFSYDRTIGVKEPRPPAAAPSASEELVDPDRDGVGPALARSDEERAVQPVVGAERRPEGRGGAEVVLAGIDELAGCEQAHHLGRGAPEAAVDDRDERPVLELELVARL